MLRRWLSERGERRRTAPTRHAIRDLEHRYMVHIGAERLLRQMLIDDLRQVKAIREVYEYARTHLDIDLDRPAELPRSRLRRWQSQL